MGRLIWFIFRAWAYWLGGLLVCWPAIVLASAMLMRGGPLYKLLVIPGSDLDFSTFFITESVLDAWPPVVFWWAVALGAAALAEALLAHRNLRQPRVLLTVAFVAAGYAGLAIFTVIVLLIFGSALAVFFPSVAAALYLRWSWRSRSLTPWFGPRGSVPRPGEIWWADVPFEEVDESKDRPCLVLAFDRPTRTAQVMKITSQDRLGQPGYLPVSAHGWSPELGKISWLRTDPVLAIPRQDFRRLAGPCPRETWAALVGKPTTS